MDPTVPPPRAARRRPAAGPRHLHPGAWWLWALGLGAAATRTTNPLVLLLLAAVAGYVVAARRGDAPWSRSYGAFLRLGLLVLGIRLVFAVLLGSPIAGTHVLFTLPEVPLPTWAQGVRIGGRVTAEGLLAALYDGLRLATLLVCVGAANALASPTRLLRTLPGALYEAGVAVVVAMTFAPNLVADVRRLRAARRLRGRADRGIAAVLSVGLPVLEGALERSVALAAAMDTRGFGRTAAVPRRLAVLTTVLTLTGLLGVCLAAYGLLTAGGGGWAVPVLVIGLAAAFAGLLLGGRRSVRTRYRPDPWALPEWLTAGSGIAVAVSTAWLASLDPLAFAPTVVPPTAPVLPVAAAAAVLLGLVPAFAAPPPPATTDTTVTPHATDTPATPAAPATAAPPAPTDPTEPRRTS
ncbi:CbiQ family ECF transporter T component [Kitasatospora putterlickiae]|uniref:CbiQ family ECF transporter T component n=1 Tax=Kitasatospora putterlickiae TaxID=221725 RepID=A0ABN1Y924_9ACTN